MLNIALAAALIVAQSAQAPQPAVSAPAAVWKLDWIEQQCQIATETPGGIGTAMRITPGSEETAVYLVGTPAQLPDIRTKSASVTLAPGGETFKATAGQIQPPGKRVLVFILGDKFASAFAKADQMRVTTDRGLVAASVKGAREAMAAMRTCIDEGL